MSEYFRNSLYRRHRFSAEVIANAVWLYFRFPLSLRMVDDTLAAAASSSPIRPSDPGRINSAASLPGTSGADQRGGSVTDGIWTNAW